MRVLMVDDHVMVLEALKLLLNQLAPELRVDTANELPQALRLASVSSYDIVLLDWNLDGSNGEQAIEQLREIGCAARIVVLSGETGSALVRRAVELGAAGFIPKRYNSESMISALACVIGGRVFLPPEALHEMAANAARGGAPGYAVAAPAAPAVLEADPRLTELTPRQIDVYRAAARGLPNKLIARELGIAESTVKTHLSAVYLALGVRNRTEATYQAFREGFHVG